MADAIGQGELFESTGEQARVELGEGVVLLRGFARDAAPDLVRRVGEIASAAPFRNMQTPGGFTMSVAMTNCGPLGWVSDRSGYRYSATDPETGKTWHAMPADYRKLASAAAAEAGFPSFAPDACLINRYQPGAKMSLHQDKDEVDFSAPIVSVSLGLPAVFMLGGLRRKDRPRRMKLEHGDVIVWGGPARKLYHGVSPMPDGEHALTGRIRYNLTFRKAR